MTPEQLQELVSLPLSDAGFEEVLQQLSMGRGYFLPGIPAVVLPGANAGATAEELVHAWNFVLSPPPAEGLTPEFDLKARILREAVGYYGSLALVPDRPCWNPGEEEAPPNTALKKAQGLLREQLENGLSLGAEFASDLYLSDVEVYLAFAHLAGYLLGSGFPQDSETAAEVLCYPGDDLDAAWQKALALATEPDD